MRAAVLSEFSFWASKCYTETKLRILIKIQNDTTISITHIVYIKGHESIQKIRGSVGELSAFIERIKDTNI